MATSKASFMVSKPSWGLAYTKFGIYSINFSLILLTSF
uniref:Uncharacterized protein MANES_06G139100 n=1 Tax=Rhizophora mucronata TaxID=61149 RepID=A0A2P2KCP8_RHIMU